MKNIHLFVVAALSLPVALAAPRVPVVRRRV